MSARARTFIAVTTSVVVLAAFIGTYPALVRYFDRFAPGPPWLWPLFMFGAIAATFVVRVIERRNGRDATLSGALYVLLVIKLLTLTAVGSVL